MAAPINTIQGALTSSSNPIISYSGDIIPSNVLQTVSDLRLPSQTIEATNNPQTFFAACNNPKLANQFKETDIAILREMLRKNPMTYYLNWHDIFGLEFDRMLKSALSKVDSSITDPLMKEWHTLFSRGYLGLLRNDISYPQYTGSTRQVFDLAPDYFQKFNAFHQKFSKVLRENVNMRKIGKPPATCNFLDEFLNKQLEEWNQVRRLFTLFHLNYNLCPDLFSFVLKSFPGAHEIHCNTVETAPLALATLVRYIDMISNSQKTIELNSLDISIFDSLLKNIQKMTPANAVSLSHQMLEQIEKHTEEMIIYRERIEKQLEKPNGLDSELGLEIACEKGTSIKLMMNWLNNIRAVLEASILTSLDPTYHTSLSYFNRIMINVAQIHETAKLTPATDPRLGLLQTLCVNQIIIPKIPFKIYEKLLQSKIDNSFYIRGYPLEELTNYYNTLSEYRKLTLNALKDIDKSTIPNRAENMLWLARIYILQYDLGVALGLRDPVEEETLPEEYLDFLADEEVSSPTVEPQVPEAPTVIIVPSQEPEEPILLPKQKAPILPPQIARATLTPRHPANPKDILRVRKLRHIEKILAKLGFKQLSDRGHGSHSIWRNDDTKRQATVPDHKEIAPGTLRSIYKQITPDTTSDT